MNCFSLEMLEFSISYHELFRIVVFMYRFVWELILLGLVAEMDSGAGPSLFPLHCCKTIHLVRINSSLNLRCSVVVDLNLLICSLRVVQTCSSLFLFDCNSSFCGLIKPFIQVRHAQGIHNVEGEKNYKAYMNPECFDAHLTPLGWQQVRS